MLELIVAFFISTLITFLIIRFKNLHERYSADSNLTGPQKFHDSPVPRIGAIGIFCGLMAAILIRGSNIDFDYQITILLICAFPTFAIGLAEDLTKKISVRKRLLFTAISSASVIICMKVQVISFGIPFLDLFFSIPFFGAIFTIFALTGLTNAYNIIDGFDGLASMVGVITLCSISYVAYSLGDKSIVFLSLSMASAILGFFIWNYPQGLIFMGDSGAYLIGFWIATLSIWLCARHSEISPWFAILINGYPVMETLFSIYRRKIHSNKCVSTPDGIHFHTLIYRRILKAKHSNKIFSQNARTAPYLWIMTVLSVTPAVIWWQSTTILMISFLVYSFFYIWLYTRIVKFNTPGWMHT
jgi:UDP-N-acetylmuramyl pentapeptide phosphotransferase/UDP-N-acetylglucosamine-1-phosphate transferase